MEGSKTSLGSNRLEDRFTLDKVLWQTMGTGYKLGKVSLFLQMHLSPNVRINSSETSFKPENLIECCCVKKLYYPCCYNSAHVHSKHAIHYFFVRVSAVQWLGAYYKTGKSSGFY